MAIATDYREEPLRTRTVGTGEVDLHVVEAGDPAKPAILLLHGFPDCHQIWSLQIQALARDYHVIAFDMRGAGRSSAPVDKAGFRIERILPDIDAVISATRGATGRVHMAGHDWGSCIGWSFLQSAGFRERVVSWTSISGPHIALLWDWARRQMLSGRPRQMMGALSQFAHSWYIFAINVPGVGPLMVGLGGRALWQATLRMGGVPADDAYLDISADEVRSRALHPLKLYQRNAFFPPSLPEPGSITTPTQLVILQDDVFIRPQIFTCLSDYVSDLHVEELVANHWALRSHPAEITRLIAAQVQRVESANL